MLSDKNPYVSILIICSGIAIFIINESQTTETRRITNGFKVDGDKRYMVYLLKAPMARNNYSGWMCGGAIITPQYILTSATCVIDVDFAYVISGYKMYVPAEQIDVDECTKRVKRRIIFTCYSKKLKPHYFFNKYDYWNHGDIAVARVDRDFEYYDMSYYKYCSYPPAPIKVNLRPRFYSNPMTVMSLGWGHRSHFRPVGSSMDMNEQWLRYSTGKLLDPQTCFEQYIEKMNLPEMKSNFKHFLICVYFPAKMDENGYMSDQGETLDCAILRNGSSIDYEECKKKMQYLRYGNSNLTGGICQNDHGGPLIAYLGGHEKVIGVATGFIVNSKMECIPPYMYTNTRCFGKAIRCTINPSFSGHTNRRSAMCNGPAEARGVFERNITWPDSLLDEEDVKEKDGKSEPDDKREKEKDGKTDSDVSFSEEEEYKEKDANNEPMQLFSDANDDIVFSDEEDLTVKSTDAL